jgi:uncharacterized membrane protein
MQNIQITKGVISPIECVKNGWYLLEQNYWLIFGVVTLEWIFFSLMGFIPVVGSLISILFQGTLIAGVYYMLIKQIRGQQTSFGEMFQGFKKFLPTLILGILSAIPDILFFITAYSLNILTALQSKLTDQNQIIALGIGIVLGSIVFIAVFFILKLIFGILFFFVFQLIMDHDISIGEAIRLSFNGARQNLGGLLLLWLLEFVIIIGGLLLFCIGFLFVMPIIYAANTFAYRQVFPDSYNNFLTNPSVNYNPNC